MEKRGPFVVAISGDPLSGKSTALKGLIEKYKNDGYFIEGMSDFQKPQNKIIQIVAAGELFRRLANYAGITVDELSTFAKKTGDSMEELMSMATDKSYFEKLSPDALAMGVDAFIDNYMLSTIESVREQYKDSQDVIIFADSRIIGLLMNRAGKEVFNVRFSVQQEIAAERLLKDAQNRLSEIVVAEDKEAAYEEALKRVIKRRNGDRERFIKTYSEDIYNQDENDKMDLQNLDNYDLVMNTSGVATNRIIKVLFECIEKSRNGEKIKPFWRGTKYMYPGRATDDQSPGSREPVIGAIKVKGQYYALKGQEYVGISNHNGYKMEQETGSEEGYLLLPVDLVAKKEQFIFVKNGDSIEGVTAAEYAKNIDLEVIRAFEKKYGFKYPERGVIPLPEHSQSAKSKDEGMER